MSRREPPFTTITTTAVVEDEQPATDAHSSKKLKNRIAQQKYRTNLKKRLQELEAVAATNPNRPNQRRGEDPNPLATTAGSGPSNKASIASTSDVPINDDEASSQQILRPNFFNVMDTNLTWDQCHDPHVESIYFDSATNLLTNGGHISTHTDHIDRLSPTSLNQPPILLSGPQPISSDGAEPGMTMKRDGQGIMPMRPESARAEKVDRNMRYVLDAVSQAGFESFDAAVTHYYTEPIECDPAVNAVQKMSRNRHLPCVLRALRSSTQAWPLWQVNGYKDEIIRSAEGILSDELDRSSAQFEVDSDSNSRSNAMEEFPHLWALMHGLAATQSIEVCRRRQRTLMNVLTTLVHMLATDVRVV